MKNTFNIAPLLCLSVLVLTIFIMASCNGSRAEPPSSDAVTESTQATQASTPPEETTSGKDAFPHIHFYGPWLTLQKATLTEEGIKERTCSCGAREEQVIPALVSVGLAYEVNEDGRTCKIIGRGSCTDATVYFPFEIEGYRVTSIGERAFYYDYTVAGIVLPESIERIEASAFHGCGKMTVVKLPDNLASIDEFAFADCTNLKSIKLPEDLVRLGANAFNGCEALVGITVPGSVGKLNDSVFKLCTSLVTVNLGEGISAIAPGAFNVCSSLVSIVLPNSVKSIGAYAFALCDNLTSVTLSSSLKTIGENAFSNCYSLVDITLPEGLVSIGKTAFSECTRIPEMTIPTSVSSIGFNAFRGCHFVKNENNVYYVDTWVVGSGSIPSSITLRKGTVGIATDAFYNCKYLETVTLPDSVKYIDAFAFQECDRLEEIIFEGTVAQWNAIEKGADWDDKTGDYTVHCSDGDVTKQ